MVCMSCEEAFEQILEEKMDAGTSEEEEEKETEHSVLTKTLNSFLENLNAKFNMDFFVSTGVAMLMPLLDICRGGVTEISEASRLVSNSHIYASTVFRSESRLWLEAIHRRLSGRRRVRNPFFTEITRDIPYEMFRIFVKVIKSVDGFAEPFVSFGQNRKAKVVSFTTLRPVKQLLSVLSGMNEDEVVKYFKRTLTGRKIGSKVAVLATEEKDMAFMYRLSKGQLVISFHYGEWNKFGFPQHN